MVYSRALRQTNTSSLSPLARGIAFGETVCTSFLRQAVLA